MIRTLILAALALCISTLAHAALSPAQLAALKSAIVANPTWSAYPTTSDGHYALAAALNQPASPTFSVWRTNCSTAAISDAINWAVYTPTDTISEADTDPAITRRVARLLIIQVKQMNLQIMTQGRETVNTSLPNVRGGLRDAVIQVPSGASGANTSPGGASGVNVLTACTRNATEAERILATPSSGSDTTGSVTARVLGFEGAVTPTDVESARNLP